MKIKRAIVSTDSNPLYCEFWPLVAKAWKNIDIDPVVVGLDVDLNPDLGTVIKLSSIDGIPNSFVTQVVRLIAPCFFPDEVCIIGDIDMIPLSRSYFNNHISHYSDDTILIFSSDAYKQNIPRYPMCYIAAKGQYFKKIIGLSDTNITTIQTFIKKLYELNLQWDTDELFFAKQLHSSRLLNRAIFLKRGWKNNIANNRIDRVNWYINTLNLSMGRYIDAHCVRPLSQNLDNLRPLIDYIEAGSINHTKRSKKNILERFTKVIEAINSYLRATFNLQNDHVK